MKRIAGAGRNWELMIHFTMALCGGFFGVYAILSRVGNFGQAQTANLIEMICSILGKDWMDVGIRLLSAVIFMAGMVAATVLEKKSRRDIRYLAVAVDAVAAVWIGCIPTDVDPVLALYPVFFATAFQWCIFKGANGYVSATIFCSNNLKQITVSVTEYFLMSQGDPNRDEKKEKARFFGGTFCSFYAGVCLGGVLWYIAGIYSIWFNLFALFISAALIHADRMQKKQKIVEQGILAYDGKDGGR